MVGQQAFEIEALERVEAAYRRQLEHDPGDTECRTGLAWCLFMQALHRAGEERVLGALLDSGAADEAALGDLASGDGEASALLRECLRQTVAVLHLSQDARDRTDAERLQGLVALSGGGSAVSEAQEQAARTLARVTRSVFRRRSSGAREPWRRRRMDGSKARG